jgi:Domain of unknown function (DUF4384)/Caspase domain
MTAPNTGLARWIQMAMFAGALLAGGASSAQTVTLPQAAELKAEKFTDADTLRRLPAGASLEILRREGGWVWVRADSKQGWLRAEALTASATSGAQALESGRSGRGNLVATTGVRGGHAKPAAANVHTLIMALGDYPKPHQLEGVKHDVDSAIDIARRMGVTDAHLQVIRDGELTLEGMRFAFDRLEASLADNDQVFIYYSGHGGRQLVREADGSERCAESLTAIDGRPFLDTELEERLKRMSSRTEKLVMFIDACHSGGVTTRAVKNDPAFSPKHWSGKDVQGKDVQGKDVQDKDVQGDACSRPTNVVTRAPARPAGTGSGSGNFAYIAAARDNEISLDQAARGGLATQAWQACLAGEARDLDGSGALSVEEIRACAQTRIDQSLRDVQGYLPHHVSVAGNKELVLAYAARATDGSGGPAAGSAAGQGAGQANPIAALNDILNNRDDRRLVTLRSESPRLKIAQDELRFSVNSREAGFLYLLMVGSDGKTFDLLFPNQIDRNNRIQAGETVSLPRAGWRLRAEGPPGTDTLLAIVTDAPRDFSAAGLKPSGPFSVVEAVAAKDIQLVTASATSAGSDECSAERQLRNIAVEKSCSSAYGAAMLQLEEFK